MRLSGLLLFTGRFARIELTCLTVVLRSIWDVYYSSTGIFLMPCFFSVRVLCLAYNLLLSGYISLLLVVIDILTAA